MDEKTSSIIGFSISIGLILLVVIISLIIKQFLKTTNVKPQIDEFLRQYFKENSIYYTAVYSATAFRSRSAAKEWGSYFAKSFILRLCGIRTPHVSMESDHRYDYLFIFGNNDMFLLPISLDNKLGNLSFDINNMIKLDENNIANIKYRKNSTGAEIKLLDDSYILLSIPKVFFRNNDQSNELQKYKDYMNANKDKINNLSSVRA